MTEAKHGPRTELVDFAADLARGAGDLIRSAAFDKGEATTKSSAADWVTPIDRSVEAWLREAITARYPGHAIVGEELGVTPGAHEAAHAWHIDPIDGTTNFLHGLGNVAVSIAVVDHTGPVAAAVQDVYRGQTITAARGHGVHLDGTPQKPVVAEDLAGNVLLTEWSGHRAWDGMDSFLRWATDRTATVRILGSCALALASAGLGRAPVCILPGRYNSWDVAAGLLIATEGGLSVRGRHDETEPVPQDGLLVAPSALIDDVRDAWLEAAEALT